MSLGHGAGFNSFKDTIPGYNPSRKPVRVGNEYDVTISEISRRGDGIAKIEGFIVFVAGAKQGWQGKIRVTQLSSRYATGQLIRNKFADSDLDRVERVPRRTSLTDTEPKGHSFTLRRHRSRSPPNRNRIKRVSASCIEMWNTVPDANIIAFWESGIHLWRPIRTAIRHNEHSTLSKISKTIFSYSNAVTKAETNEGTVLLQRAKESEVPLGTSLLEGRIIDVLGESMFNTVCETLVEYAGITGVIARRITNPELISTDELLSTLSEPTIEVDRLDKAISDLIIRTGRNEERGRPMDFEEVRTVYDKVTESKPRLGQKAIVVSRMVAQFLESNAQTMEQKVIA